MKTFLKETFPTQWAFAWKLYSFLKERANPTRRYARYFVPTTPERLIAEPFLWELVVPPGIDTILDIGCASGRNFLPFDGKYKLIGVDIVPQSQIKWVANFKNLTYYQDTLSTFRKRMNDENIDLSRTLVMCFGTLMCVTKWTQWRFHRACKKHGGKTFLFMEYPRGTDIFGRNFMLDRKDFVEIHRDDFSALPVVAYTQGL
jgi:SAM-dependent methyltransferase